MKNFSNPQFFKIVNLFQKISQIAIYFLILLMPVFFLPFTIDSREFSKQILLIIFVSISLFSYLAKKIISNESEFNLNLYHIPVLVFFLVYGLSTIFSQWSYASFWGWPLNVSQGFLNLIYFLTLFFLIPHIFTKKEENSKHPQPKFGGRATGQVFRPLFILTISGVITVLVSLLQIFGIFIFPWEFAENTFFNPFGTLTSASVFIAALLPLTISLLFLVEKRLIKFFFLTSIFLFSLFLILVNPWLTWIVLILGLSILFVFGILNLKEAGHTKFIWLPMSLLIIALFFLAFRISLIETPVEILPTQGVQLTITKNALSGIKNFFLGTGPATFIFDFLKFKPIEINQTLFWDTRFTNGASEVLDKLITSGVLGVLSLLFIFGFYLFASSKFLKDKVAFVKKNQNLPLFLGLFSTFFCLVLGQFLIPANLSLLFFFWVFLGFLSFFFPKAKIWSFKLSNLISIILTVLIFLFGTTLLFISFRNYFGEIKYFQGLKAWQVNKTDEAINNFKKAINLNPNLDIYWRDLSQLYLSKLNEFLTSNQQSPEVQEIISSTLDSAKKATEISPKNVANWNVRGFIHRNLIGLVGGAEDWAIKSYREANELEPKNPYILKEIGLVYLAKVDLLIGTGVSEEKEILENLTLAKDNFQRAIELKSDYVPAHFQLAMIYQREGKEKEAISKLEGLKPFAPFNIGLAFQLGLLYYNGNELEKAKAEFERVMILDENFSNARYFLGLVYDRLGEKNKAIEQFEKIERLNPENLEVKRILENLRAGLPALEGIQMPRPPIEESLPERLEK